MRLLFSSTGLVTTSSSASITILRIIMDKNRARGRGAGSPCSFPTLTSDRVITEISAWVTCELHFFYEAGMRNGVEGIFRPLIGLDARCFTKIFHVKVAVSIGPTLDPMERAFRVAP